VFSRCKVAKVGLQCHDLAQIIHCIRVVHKNCKDLLDLLLPPPASTLIPDVRQSWWTLRTRHMDGAKSGQRGYTFLLLYYLGSLRIYIIVTMVN